MRKKKVPLSEALQRGRGDVPFFAHHFCSRKLHDGQAEFTTSANATINVLATSNRWGKTSTLAVMHAHAGIYKTGAEARYMTDDGVDMSALLGLRYVTVHAADLYETVELVHADFLAMTRENALLAAFVDRAPRSKPHNITFITGSRWEFRTLGTNAEGIDGKSYYLITIDEAGWIDALRRKMDNVARIRVADVRGRIVLAGTFKPGVSRDFYGYAVRAAAATGRDIGFDHRGASGKEQRHPSGVDASIVRLCQRFGVSPDELLGLGEAA